MPVVDVVATVRAFGGASEVESPVSGARGFVVHVELFEGEESLGVVVLGDGIALVTDAGERYVVMARRATFGFVSTRKRVALDSGAAELVPLLSRSRGGVVTATEMVLREGDRVRLRAHVEAGRVREDEGPVRLDEAI